VAASQSSRWRDARARPQSRSRGTGQLGDGGADDVHVGVVEVLVRLAAPGRDVLDVVGARQALVVPDHVLDRQVELAAQPARQLERRVVLGLVVHHLLV
jgi:hypothetical protein